MPIANDTKTVVGVFNSVQDAQEAVRDLEMEGISRQDISIVANKNATGYETMEPSDKSSNVVADAGIGAAIGGVGGLLLSAAGLITVPVIGPILAAGPIAAALTGAGIGAAAGGLVGALTESGVPEEDAKYYAEGVRRGDVLVTVKAEGVRADRASEIMDNHGAVDVKDRVSNWKERGWTGYNNSANPYSPDELRKERSYYSSEPRQVEAGRAMRRGATRVYDRTT
jgi:Predicted membrane protein